MTLPARMRTPRDKIGRAVQGSGPSKQGWTYPPVEENQVTHQVGPIEEWQTQSMWGSSKATSTPVDSVEETLGNGILCGAELKRRTQAYRGSNHIIVNAIHWPSPSFGHSDYDRVGWDTFKVNEAFVDQGTGSSFGGQQILAWQVAAAPIEFEGQSKEDIDAWWKGQGHLSQEFPRYAAYDPRVWAIIDTHPTLDQLQEKGLGYEGWRRSAETENLAGEPQPPPDIDVPSTCQVISGRMSKIFSDTLIARHAFGNKHIGASGKEIEGKHWPEAPEGWQRPYRWSTR